LVVVGLELGLILGRCSTTWTTPPALIALFFLIGVLIQVLSAGMNAYFIT
jgi:hypothetical protein